jgi:hypothetical protein
MNSLDSRAMPRAMNLAIGSTLIGHLGESTKERIRPVTPSCVKPDSRRGWRSSGALIGFQLAGRIYPIRCSGKSAIRRSMSER